jgi:hypothetical protein
MRVQKFRSIEEMNKAPVLGIPGVAFRAFLAAVRVIGRSHRSAIRAVSLSSALSKKRKKLASNTLS